MMPQAKSSEWSYQNMNMLYEDQCFCVRNHMLFVCIVSDLLLTHSEKKLEKNIVELQCWINSGQTILTLFSMGGGHICPPKVNSRGLTPKGSKVSANTF